MKKQIELWNKDWRQLLNLAYAIACNYLKCECSVCFFKVGKSRNKGSRIVQRDDRKITNSFDVGQKGTSNKKQISIARRIMKNSNIYDSVNAIFDICGV